MPNPTAAMLVIGDEILSGRTRDANMNHLAGALANSGIDLRECRMVQDDHAVIVSAVRELSSRFDQLFTSGGIGPTHDDITADAIADAAGVNIGVRDDARALLEAHYDREGIELNAARLRMARIPDGATLIDNPVSAAPGFTLRNIHVMAGIPAIFQAMLASLLPTLTGGDPVQSRTLRVDKPEGELAGPLAAVAASYPMLSFGSYPFIRDGVYGANIVIRGTDPGALDSGYTALEAALGAAS